MWFNALESIDICIYKSICSSRLFTIEEVMPVLHARSKINARSFNYLTFSFQCSGDEENNVAMDAATVITKSTFKLVDYDLCSLSHLAKLS